jgi:hypothetical protein
MIRNSFKQNILQKMFDTMVWSYETRHRDLIRLASWTVRVGRRRAMLATKLEQRLPGKNGTHYRQG